MELEVQEVNEVVVLYLEEQKLRKVGVVICLEVQKVTEVVSCVGRKYRR